MLSLCLALAAQTASVRTTALVVEHPRVLVFSETKGFRHDCIESAGTAIERLGKETGFTVTKTEDSSIFNDGDLARFDVVLFLCTTGDVLTDVEQAAMETFVRRGGGYVGIHSASDTEYDWSWYGGLVGAYFKSHPAIQPAKVKVEDKAHPATCDLPLDWNRTDEWYNFRANPRGKVRVLCSLDETSYKGGEMGDHPITWCQEYGGGRAFYTEFGHTTETYKEPEFRRMLSEAIFWSANGAKPDAVILPAWAKTQGWSVQEGGLFNHGNAVHLVSKQEYGDQWVHAEFKIPAGSNSGVYLMGRYEVQILDSFGKADKDLQHSDCGGIYQRFKEKEGIGYEGTPPLRNAERAPGEWNRYDILFRAPRFDAKKRKVENAKFIEVRLNGVVVQKNVSVTGPTRAAMFEDETKVGPLMLQGDHGPITYRNVWFKPVRL